MGYCVDEVRLLALSEPLVISGTSTTLQHVSIGSICRIEPDKPGRDTSMAQIDFQSQYGKLMMSQKASYRAKKGLNVPQTQSKKHIEIVDGSPGVVKERADSFAVWIEPRLLGRRHCPKLIIKSKKQDIIKACLPCPVLIPGFRILVKLDYVESELRLIENRKPVMDFEKVF